MAGYSGYSKSNNAVNAEHNGRFPLSIALKMVSEKTDLNQKQARGFLKEIHNGEYHHSSKFYNSVDYYDAKLAIQIIDLAAKNGVTDIEIVAGAARASGLSEYGMDDDECVDNFIWELDDRKCE